MKKLLLGTSALIGATAIVASASAAPELTIGGNLDFRLVGGEAQARGLNITAPTNHTADANDTSGTSARVTDSADVGGADRSWAFNRANSVSEIKFRAVGESDGGTRYGATIDYRYLAGSTDESYIFVADDWGRIHLGDDDGIVDGYVPRADHIATGAYLFNDTTTYLTPRAVDTSDSTKIAYHSPVSSGFKFGASITEKASISSGVHTLVEYDASNAAPDADADDEGRNGDTLNDVAGITAATAGANRTNIIRDDADDIGFTEIVEVGVGYAGEAGGVSYNVGLAYQTGSVDDATQRAINAEAAGIAGAGENLRASADDLAEYSVGFGVSFGGFSIGGSYADSGDSGVVTASGGDLDFTAMGGNAAGAAVQEELNGYLSDGRTFYGVGVSYDLGGGMKIAWNFGEASWSTYGGSYNAFRADNPGTADVNEARNGSFNTVDHTETLNTIDFGFPIMDGMTGYAGVAFSEYEQENTANGRNVADSVAGPAFTTEATTYLVGTTVSF